MPGPRAEPAPGSLRAELTQRIRRDGPMPVDRFMLACLTHPLHGYYATRDPIGAAGDFVTAPEISQVFGELVGLWCAVVWEAMGKPAPFRLVELGPGRGTLMRDALRAARALPGCLAAATVHLVEASGPLRRQQHETLGGVSAVGTANAPPLSWHTTVTEVPAGPAIVVAN